MNKKATLFLRFFCVLVFFAFAPINAFAADIVFTSSSKIEGAGVHLYFGGYPGTYPQNKGDYTATVTSTNSATTTITVQDAPASYLYCAMNGVPSGSEVTTITLTYTNGDCGKVTFTGGTFTSTSTCSTIPVAPSLTIDSYTSVVGTATLNMTVTGVPAPTISLVTLDGNTLSSSSYTYTTGKLVINDAALTVGNHTVVVSVTNPSGSDSDTKVITTTAAPACDPDRTLINGKTIIFSSIIRNGDYYIKITGQDLAGIGGSYIHINGTVDKALNTYTIVVNPAKTEMLIGPIVSTTKPKFHTPLYINMPNEISFSTVNGLDLNWCQEDPNPPTWNADPTMTCGGTDAFGLDVSSTDVESEIAGYRVTINSCVVDVPLASPASTHTGAITVPLSSCGITLDESSNYTATIEAYDALNNYSTIKTVTGIKLQSSPISMGTAECENIEAQSVSINVTSTGSTATSYEVSYNSLTETKDVADGKITIDGLTPETEYTFTIKAIDPCGSLSVNSIDVTCTTIFEPHGGADYPTILTDTPFELVSDADCMASVSGGTNFSALNYTGSYYHTMSQIDIIGTLALNDQFNESYSNGYFHETGISDDEYQYAIVSNPKVLNGTYKSISDGKNRLILAVGADPIGSVVNLFTYKRDHLAAGGVKLSLKIEDLVSDATCPQDNHPGSRQLKYDVYINGVAAGGGFFDLPTGTSYDFSYTGTVTDNAEISIVFAARYLKTCTALSISDLVLNACLKKAIVTSTGGTTFCENSEVTIFPTGFSGATTYEWEESNNGSDWTPIAGSSSSLNILVALGNKYYRVRETSTLEWSEVLTVLGQVCCTRLDEQETVWEETFGTGTGRWTNPNVQNHTFQPYPNKIDDTFYAVVSNSSDANQSLDWPGGKTDHTGDTNGGFLVININNTLTPPVLIYEQIITPTGGFCEDTYYNLSLYASNIAPAGLPSSFRFEVIDASTSEVLGLGESGEISTFNMSSWQNYGTSFAPQNSSSVIIRIYNTGAAGGGNDVVLDDISVTVCNAGINLCANCPKVDMEGVCGESVPLTTTINGDPLTFYGTETPYYLWQKSVNAGATWTTVASASGISKSTYSPLANIGETAIYKVIVAKDQTEAEDVVAGSSETCSRYTITNTSTITCTGGCARPDVNISPSELSICSDATGTQVLTANVESGSVSEYVWQSKAEGDADYTTLATHTSPLLSDTYTINSLPTQTTTYRVISISTEGAECADTTAMVVTVNALPTASISGGKDVCQNGTLQLTGSGATDLSWNGGAYAAVTTYDVTTTASGSQNITLKVRDANLCESAEETFTVTVNALPTAVITGDASVCQNGTLQLTGSGATDLSWNGGAYAAVTTYDVTTTVSGSQNIKLKVRDANLCESAEETFEVTVNALPTAVITGDASVCQNGTLQLTGSGATDLSWNGGAYAAVTTYDVTTTASGSQNIKLKVRDANLCESAEETFEVTVNALPTAVITGDASVCQNGTLQLTGSGATDLSWNGGAYAAVTTYDVTTTASGSQNIKLKVRDANLCESAEETFEVTVNALPTAVITGDASVCQNGTLQLTGSGATDLSWNGGAYAAVTTYDVTTTASGSQNITLKVRDANLCESAKETFTVTVNELPNISISSAAECDLDLLHYHLEVTVSEGTVTSTAGTVVDEGSNVWSISSVPTGTNITVTVTTGASCSDDLAVTAPDCSCPTIVAPVSTGDQSYCAGGTVPTLEVNSVPAGIEVDWYEASTGGVAVATNTLTYTPLAAGTYYAEAREAVSGCVSDTRTAIEVTVNALPTAVITGDASVCQNGTLQLTGSGATDLSWNGGAYAAVTTYDVTTTASGSQNITLKVRDANLCESSEESTSITVNELPNISISSAAECDLDLLHYHLEVTVSEGTVTSTAGTVVDEGSNVWSISSVPTGTNITVTVTTGASCSDDLAVTAPDCSCPTIVAPVSTGDQSYCAGGTVPTLEVNSVPAGIEVDWYEASTGGVAVATNTLTYTPLAAGTYYAEAREAVSGCVSDTRTAIEVTVNALPTAVITGDASVCQNGTLQLTGSGATDLSWNGGAYAAVTTYDVTTTASGSQNITLKVRDANLCESAEESFAVTVNALPTASITGDTEVCQNGSLQLTGSGAAELSWNGAAYGATTTYDVTTTASGSQNITLKVRDANLCESAEETFAVTVNALPTASITGDAEVCQNGSLQLTGSGATELSWNGAAYGATTTYDVTTTASGSQNITLKVRDANLCESAEETFAVTVNALPTASITGDAEVCQNGSLQLTGSGAAELSWNGAAYGATTTYDVTTTASGSQNITLKVRDANLCESAEETFAVTVNALPTAVITGGAEVCQNESLQLTGSGATELSWNGAAYGATTTYDVTTTASGSQNITLKVRDANLCESAEETFAVTVNALPTAVITGDSEVCQNGTLQLTGSGAAELSWNGAAYGATTTYDVTTTASGSQNITLKVRDTNLCESAEETFAVTVNALPTASITSDSEVCQNGSLQLTGSGAAELSWNGGVYAATTTYDVTTTASGTQNITLKVRDANLCESAEETFAVTVNALPTASITGDTEVCQNGSLQLTGSGAAELSWNGAAYGATTTYDVTTTASGPQNITLKVRDANLCESAEETFAVTVNALPTAVITGDSEVCQNGSLQLTGSGATDLSWNGGAYSTENTFSVNTTTAGVSNITLKVRDTNLCESSEESTSITVNELPNISISSAAECDLDLLHYHLEVTVSEGTVTSTAGTVVDEGSNVWSISSVPTGTNITVTVTTGASCSDDLAVTAPDCSCPTIVAPVSTGDQSYCAGGTIPTLEVNSVPAGIEVDWYEASTGGVAVATNTLTYTPLAAGTYYAEAREAVSGCVSDTRTAIEVTVNALPTAVITGDASVCQNGILQLTGSGATDLSWNGGAYAAVTTYDVTTTASGSQNITLKVRDANLCESAEESTSITVNELPNISISSAAECDLDLLHYHLEVTVSEGTVTSTAGTVVDEGSNVWSISSVPTGTNITVTVTTGASCSDDLAVTAPDCSCPTIVAPVSTGDQSYCAGGTVPTLEVNSVPAGIEVDWYEASTGGVAVATNTLTYTPLAAGTYYAEAREAVSGCVSDTRTAIEVTVNALPTAVITGDASVCQNGTLQLTGSGATDLSWNGGAYAAVTTYDVTTTASGSQNITLKVRDANLCESAEETFTVTVNALPTAVITGDASVCQNGTLQLTGSGATDLSWNGGAYSTENTFSVNTTTAGVSNITLKVRDTNLCESSEESTSITVNELPNISISSAAECDLDLLHYHLEVTVSEGTVTSTAGTVVDEGSNVWSISSVPTGTNITVTVTTGASCSDDLAVTAPDCSCPTIVAPVSTGDQSYCAGGTIPTLEVNSVPAGIEVDWYEASTGGVAVATNTLTYTPLAAGTYYAEAREAVSGCVSDTRTAIAVTVNALPTAVITGDASVCQNGTLQLTGSGATDLSWNGGAYSTENTFSVNTTTAGVSNITLKVRDTNLCESSEESTSITVNELPNISISSAAECDLDLLHYHLEVTVSEGTVTSTAGTVVDEGSNVWSISSVPTGTNITVTVTTGASCSDDLAVTAPDCSCPTIVAPVSTGDQSYCAGGTVPTLEVNSVPAGIEVDWYEASTGGVAVATNTLTYTPLAAGTYYAEAREAVSGCVSDTRTAIAVTVNALPTAVITGDASVCQNGTLQLTGSGATDLSWNGGAYAAVTTYDVTTTASGSQNIKLKVRDANLCESAEETFAVTVNALPTAVITGGAEVCQNGSLQLTGSGATELSWNGAAYGATTTYDVTTTASGSQNIKLKVRDANLCESAEETFAVTVNALPTAVITGGAEVCQNGSLQLTGSGATELSWNGAAYGATTTYDVTTTASGSQNITLKVRDANLCESAKETFTVTVNALPTISIVSQTDNINCDAPYTGQFELQGSDGTMPYSYWVDGVDYAGQTVYDNIQSTTSTAYVIDDNDCKSDDMAVTILDNSLPITVDFTATASNGGNYCEGTGGVDITVSATQLSVTYTLFKDGVSVGSLAGTGSDITFTSNEQGSYEVQATSTGNCKRDMSNLPITVTEYARPVVQSVVSSPTPTCAGEELTFTASSDMTAVSYIWTYAGYTATEIDDRLIIDPTLGGVTYSGTVKAMKDGCESAIDFPYSYSVALKPVLSIVLSNPSTGALLTSPATVTCTDPTVRATLSGGYRYEWLDTHQVNTVRDLATANIYDVMAFDINGCPSDVSSIVILADQDKPQDLLITPSILDVTLTCLNPTMTLTASSSTPNVTYLWNDDLNSTTETISVNKSRIYQVTVTSLNGCTEMTDILVSDNKVLPQLSISSTSDKLTCTTTSIQQTGVVSNESEVGTPIVYEWLDDPAMPQSRTITLPGIYSLRATAANGCVSESSMQITEDKVLPTVWIDLLTDTLTCNHPSILLTAKSDVPVTFEWDDLSVGDTYIATEARTYIIKGTALNGCEAQNDTTLQDATASPTITITADSPVVTCKSVILTATGGVSYEWSDASTGTTLEITDGGNYSVEGTNRYGCTSTAQITLTEDKTAPTVSLNPTAGTLTCKNPTLTVTSVGTPSSVSYRWNDGVITSTRTISIKGTYTVTVTNPDNNCTRAASIVVSENKAKPMLEIVELPQVCLPAEIDLADAIGSNTIADNVAYYEDEQLTIPIIDTRITVSSNQLYYAQGISVNSSGCLGDAEPIALNIKAVTTKPIVNNYDECTRKGSKSLTELVTSQYQTLRFYDTEVGGQPRSTIIDASQSNTTTSYWVSDARAGLCESERTEIVVHIEGEIDYDLSASTDKLLAGKDEVTITATPTTESAAIDTYKWNINGVSVEGSSDTYTEYPYVNTVYELSASGRCNTLVKSVSVEAKWQTAITPENNGKNDVFAKGHHITVFNRYSEKVFEGDDGWDGIIDSNFAKKGEVAEPGVYFYYINLPNGTVQRATIEVVKF